MVWISPRRSRRPSKWLRADEELQPGIFTGAGKVGAVKGIAAFQSNTPALLEQGAFFQPHASLAGLAFIVPQHSGRLDDYLVAGLPRAQAEIHIVVIYREDLVETVQFFEDAFADGQAGARHC